MLLTRENNVEWPWMLYIEMFIAGIAAGAFVIAAILELLGRGRSPAARTAHMIAFPLMIVATFLLIIDLKRPERFWHMALQNHTLWPMFKWWSPISYGTWLVMGFTGFAFVSFLDALIADGWMRLGGWKRDNTLHGSRLGPLWAIGGALFAFGVAAYSGLLLSTTLIPGWAHSPLIGSLFVAISGTTGAAAILLILALRRRIDTAEVDGLRQAMTWLLIWQTAVLLLFLATAGEGIWFFLTPSIRAAGAILVGIVLGIVLPLVLWFYPRSWRWIPFSPAPQRPARLAVPASLVLIGGFLLRYAIIRGPQHAIG
jgi:formate-dependent nitrite reductase membrane component NrfD